MSSTPIPSSVATPSPVGLKEAALDSPTFRASTTHFSQQIEYIERWLEDHVKCGTRLCHELSNLEPAVHSWLQQQSPTLSEAAIDHDYTMLAVQQYSKTAHDFWASTSQVVRRHEAALYEIKAFISQDLKSFRDVKRQVDHTQRNFDHVLSRYASQAKSKEASSLRENAFQLHEARKSYLRASMDFCIASSAMKISLDKLLVKAFASYNKSLCPSTLVDRIQEWGNDLSVSELALKRDLSAARRQLEYDTLNATLPSRELDDYSDKTTAFPASPTDQKPEKTGWLFLKSVVGKPSRTVWTRKWVSVSNGVLSWLDPRPGQESERVAVLLCSVRPATSEERRFCFEVKTMENSVVLQAETAPDLLLWIDVFELAKRKALGGANPTVGIDHEDSEMRRSVDTRPGVASPLNSAVSINSNVVNPPAHITADLSSSSDWNLSYPQALKGYDAQFHALFPPRNEQVVLVFRATWCAQQEFPGRMYVTTRGLHFYSNHLGFVLKQSLDFTTIKEITTAPGLQGLGGDFVYLHLKDGRVTIKTFLEPLDLLGRRLDYLVRAQSPSLDQVFKALEEPLDVKPARFKLPDKPVKYTVLNMNEPLTQQFSISAKALFHIMFGDRSAVFLELLACRGLSPQVQEPWVDNRRMLSGEASQAIQVQNDHLCYVISESRPATNFPHPLDLTVKYIITHTAKSRCHFSIYHQTSSSSSIITKYALRDLRYEATDLMTIVDDQVSQLGKSTSKAIEVFGVVGQNDSTITRNATARKVNQYSLLGLYGRQVALYMSSAYGVFVAHRVTIFVLVITYLFLTWTYRGGRAYYNDRKAAWYMSRLGVGADKTMHRAIFLHDMDPMAVSNISDHGTLFVQAMADSSAQATRYQQTRELAARQRHRMLVGLRVINFVENEAISAHKWEWNNHERARCRQAAHMLEDYAASGQNVKDIGIQVKGYCDRFP